MLYDILIAPFTDFEFMRRALAGVIALALGGAPIGVFLMLRRMSLVGDAMAHAILPGAAIGFLISGLNLFAMTFGGLIAGFAVAILSGVVARSTELKEDASLATFYLVSLALGVTIVSMRGTNIDLLHVLFGNILALDENTIADLSALITRWHGERRTIITVLHDLDLVRSRFPESLLLAREVVAWGPTKEVLTESNLAKARRMCEVFHPDAPVCEAAA
jgi:ABC-type Mn2+/Zn2+ transport system permease subunit